MGSNYDFSGWATKNDLRCSDGRTIRKDAFKDNDGQTVPLVWQHLHNEPSNVLGHALLENRAEGVYAYGKFNNTEKGKEAKELVQHGDVNALSIYANQLRQQNGGDVIHGKIREVSLVLAGANPGALIDFPILEHGYDDAEPEEAVIYTGENLELYHADETQTEEPAEEEKSDEIVKKDAGVDVGEDEEEDEDLSHAEGENMADKTVKEVFDELTEEQKNVVYFMIGQALEDAGVDIDEEGEEMKHNIFDTDLERPEDVLSHADQLAIIEDGKRHGSLKESFLAHAAAYGIEDIELLFPEDRFIDNTPGFITRDMDWVQKVMSAVHHTPFSRIKSIYANLTEDAARAKGYLKGKKKKEEVFSLLKRTTTPQTIYKKQKLDRDDVVDITDFDVVAWLKREMRLMLDEEIARAILIGDGRLSSDDDKISEDHVKPIASDDDLYAIKAKIGSQDARDFIKAAIKSRKNYKGSGNPTLFTTEDMLTNMLLLEDGINRPLYDDVSRLATVLRVKEIVTVPVMENAEIGGDNPEAVLGIIVNLADYNVGADQGGAINMFDDFDIDYNAQKYLIETRISGALTVPYSAIVLTDGTQEEEEETVSDNNGQGESDNNGQE